jgi:hypothetical protein
MNACSLAWLTASLLCALVPPAHGQPAAAGWVADAHGCKVANPQPQPVESIHWSGQCKEGFADGTGMVTWYSQGQSNGVTAGTFRNGKLTGRGYVTLPRPIYTGMDGDEMARSWPPGSRLDGEFADNHLLGDGAVTLANGHKVVVNEVKGRLVRKSGFVPARALR